MLGIIIVNQEIGHNQYKIKRFKEAFSSLGVDLKTYINDGTLSIIKDGHVQINLPKADFIIYLDKDIYLARSLENNGFRLFNRADFIKLCDDKTLTCIKCSNLNIKMPKTISAPLVYSKELSESNYKFLDAVAKELKYPYVLKEVYGSLGLGVHLINNLEEARTAYSKLYRQPLQFQEYISSSYGKSMRVIVIDKEVIGSFVRYNTGDFRSNYGNNAGSIKVEQNENFLKFAQKISDYLNIEYAGIDLLFGENDEPILCEINSNAFFEEFEKTTGIDVAILFAKMVLKKINQ